MTADGLDSGQRDQIARLEAANAAFYRAVEGGDLDTLAELWVGEEHGDTALCVHPGWPALRGREELLRSFAIIMANTPYIQFFLTDLSVQVVGELAVVNCVENMLTSVGAEQGDPDEEAGLGGGQAVATNVFRQVEGGWRLWLHHASPVLAPPEEGE